MRLVNFDPALLNDDNGRPNTNNGIICLGNPVIQYVPNLIQLTYTDGSNFNHLTKTHCMKDYWFTKYGNNMLQIGLLKNHPNMTATDSTRFWSLLFSHHADVKGNPIKGDFKIWTERDRVGDIELLAAGQLPNGIVLSLFRVPSDLCYTINGRAYSTRTGSCANGIVTNGRLDMRSNNIEMRKGSYHDYVYVEPDFYIQRQTNKIFN